MSTLGSKLSTLRRQSGMTAPTAEEVPSLAETRPTPAGASEAREPHDSVHDLPPAPDAPSNRISLGERLQRAATTRRRQGTSRSRLPDTDLAHRLGGIIIAPGLIRVDRLIAFGETHGTTAIVHDIASSLAYFGHASDAVFMDTETTGLAGGTGTAVFLIGLGRLTDAGLVVRQYFLTGFSGEQALLESSADFVGSAASLVTFNGKSFDAPLLATRYRLAGIADPFARLPHFDLLHATRRAYAGRWENCRLQTAERELLGFRRSDDLPGAEAPMAWFEWVRFGIHQRLPALLRHNHWDVVSLAALTSRLAAAYQEPAPHHANVLAVARHKAGTGGEDAAYAHLLEHRELLDERGLLSLARLARDRQDWNTATGIWGTLAEQGNMEALERLAKYHEHQARDLSAALAFTERLLAAAPDNPVHRHRRKRLIRRITVEPNAAAPFPDRDAQAYT